MLKNKKPELLKVPVKNPFPVFRGEEVKVFYADLESFMHDVHGSVVALRKTVHHYCDDDFNSVKKTANEVIHLEGRADQTRRKMQRALYEGVLMPFGREDKYALMEAIDDIADKAEIVVRMAKIDRPKLPKGVPEHLRELVDFVEASSEQLQSSVLALNTDLSQAIELASKVEIIREKVRMKEFILLKQLFSNRKPTVTTLILKDLVSLISQVADRSEEAADRVITLAVKYQG